MHIKIAVFGILLFLSNPLLAQEMHSNDYWELLSTLSMEIDVEEQDTSYLPVFSEGLSSLNQRTIIIEGELLKNQLRPNYYILYCPKSKNLCTGFDVGKAIEFPKEALDTKSEFVRLKGVLSFNLEDREALVFQLKEVKQLK